MGVKTKMYLKLNKAFKYSPSTNLGIFHYLQSLDVPWKEENIDAHLDFFYHLNHSGNKITSPLIDSFIDETTHEISTTNIQEIADIIYSLFGQTWARMWAVYNAEYNPINNYDMTETFEETRETEYGKTQTRTDELTETRTDELTETRTDNLTEERTDDLTQLETPAQTKTTSESVYGFNSSDASPSREVSEQNGGTYTRDNDGTVTTENTGTQTVDNTGTQTVDNTGTQTLEDSGTDTVETGHTLTRLGNIGVTTSQQMLQSEIDLWQWNFFNSVVFPNIDGVLTIALY